MYSYLVEVFNCLFIFFSGVPSVGSVVKNVKSQKYYFDSVVVKILESQIRSRVLNTAILVLFSEDCAYLVLVMLRCILSQVEQLKTIDHYLFISSAEKPEIEFEISANCQVTSLLSLIRVQPH